MFGITKEIDALKQLFSNLSEIDKQQFLTSITQETAVKKSFSQNKSPVVHTANLRTLSKMARNNAKNPLLSRQVLFYMAHKKILRSEKIHSLYDEKYPLHKCATVFGINQVAPISVPTTGVNKA